MAEPPLLDKGDRQPERWAADSGDRDVVTLNVPADALHERRFEIFVHLVVGNRAARADATHALRVMVDGALEWQRSVPTQVDGHDSLDLRLRRVVPAGRPLRLNATCALKGSQRVGLTITAEEE